MKSIQDLFLKFLGDPNKRSLKKLSPIVDEVNAFEDRIKKLSDEELKAKTEEFKKLLNEGKTLDDILPEAFAVVREASYRILGERPYDVQVMGGVALHQGRIAEMKTGEGKTLTSTMPTYLNALSGKGVHLVTVNDYLAKRDTNWMGAVFHALGLSIGCIQHAKSFIFEPKVESDKDEVSVEHANLKEVSRREAYQADITYGTNNEFGFDYLRDNMVQSLDEMVQIRDPKKADKIESHLNFAIVDEVDSILIDEARTPLIISAPDEESTKLYRQFARLVPQLKENKHFNVDEKMRAVILTEEGIKEVEDLLEMDNLYQQEGIAYVHHLQQALKAHVLFKLDKDYVVKEGQVVIVDEFTGRIMPGRRFSEGLHQALEAKEGVEVQRESKTLATITFQNYFRLYKKISGMTGTAMTSAEEFNRVYKLEITSVPTHKLMIRDDMPDKIFKTEEGKLKAVTKEVKKRYKNGQPVLIGTIAIEKSELLSKYLDRDGIKHEVLNAKNHEKEAQIVSSAGTAGSVTIATNMAGRGTDIKLDDKAKKLGGLHILGTERHEARRIDDQLRGRSGRQGDPGSSQFFVSMEDELMKRFGSDRVKGMMDSLGIPDDEPIENKLVSRSIEKAQGRIEGHNLDIRKHVLEYDDVMNKQREIIYQKRRDLLLNSDKIHDSIKKSFKDTIDRLVNFHCNEHIEERDWNIKEITENSRAIFALTEEERKKLEEQTQNIQKELNIPKSEKIKKITKNIWESAWGKYSMKNEVIKKEELNNIEKIVSLRTVDILWMDHLENIQYLREGVGLRGYGQRDPLVEYKKEGYRYFQQLLLKIEEDTISTLSKIEVVRNQSPMEDKMRKATFAKQEVTEEGSQKKEVQPQQLTSDKVGRNDPCPCGSGKKYKKCCGKK